MTPKVDIHVGFFLKEKRKMLKLKCIFQKDLYGNCSHIVVSTVSTALIAVNLC